MISFGKKKKIFLDYASATPLLKEARKEMERFWSKDFQNASAVYEDGRAAKKALEGYRTRIARLLHVGAKDVVFTSGGTESDNLAILGSYEAAVDELRRPHLVISAVEHPAVMEAAKEVLRRGGEVTILPVDENGHVNLADVQGAIKRTTYLVSVMYANNEIGTIEPVGKIGRMVRDYRRKNESAYPYFHTDASQAGNCLSLDLEALSVDLATLDAGKIYGPKGIGALVVRPGVTIRPTVWGGGQEKGLRSGTESLALVAGFARALEIAQAGREKEEERFFGLKELFFKELKECSLKFVLNGRVDESLPNIVSVSIPGQIAEYLLLKLDSMGIEASAGASCSGGESSSVITAIGKPELASSTLRFSFGRFTTEREARTAAKALCQIIKQG